MQLRFQYVRLRSVQRWVHVWITNEKDVEEIGRQISWVKIEANACNTVMLTLLRPRSSVPPVDLSIKHFRKTNFKFWFHLNTVPPFLIRYVPLPAHVTLADSNVTLREARERNICDIKNLISPWQIPLRPHRGPTRHCANSGILLTFRPTVAHTHTSLILYPHELRWRTRKPSLVTRPSFQHYVCSVIIIMSEKIKLNVPPLK